jgi:hypothetical protein
MRSPLRLALAAVGLLAAACHDSPSESTPAVVGVPQTLLSRFQGNVTQRYTAELSTLDAGSRGTFVYTSTWGRRGSGPCDVTNCGNVVYVWSVGANGPTRVDSLEVGDTGSVTTTGDVQVSDDGALLVVATEPLGTLVTYSLADPAHPKLLSRFVTSDLSNGVHTAQVSRVDGKLYAFCSIDPRNGAKARLTIVDLSDPASPKQVFTRVMGNPFVHDVYVRDGYLFTALWDDGITIWDIGARGRGSPSAPDSVSNVRTVNGQVHNLYWNGGRWLFAGEEGPGGIGASSSGDLHVVDVGDITRPREAAYFDVPGAGPHNFSVDEANGVLYSAFYNAGVFAFDIRGDVGTCTAAQQGSNGRCDLAKTGRTIGRGLGAGAQVYVWGVEYLKGAVYASDMIGGLWVLAPVSR